MNVLYCGDILQLFPSYSDFKDRRWILIAGCISNNVLTYTAIMLNIVTLYAVRKSSSVPKTLRTLMLSLAVSDFVVGVFVRFYIIYGHLAANEQSQLWRLQHDG